MSLLGKPFSVPIRQSDYIEGIVISHNLTNNHVILIDEDNEKWWTKTNTN